MKNLSTVVFCLAMSVQANAGVKESISDLIGSTDSAKPEAEAPAAVEGAAAKASTSGMLEKGVQLLPILTQVLGISDSKALGGMGSLLQAVQGIMSEGDYSAVLSAIPNVASYLSAAPKVESGEKKGGALNDVIATASALSGQAKSLSTLTSQFDSLGLDMKMAPQFADAAQSYFNKSGNDSASELLGSAVSKLLD